MKECELCENSVSAVVWKDVGPQNVCGVAVFDSLNVDLVCEKIIEARSKDSICPYFKDGYLNEC